MASPKPQPTTLDLMQEQLDRTLVEVREIEVRTRSDDRVQDLIRRRLQVSFDRDTITERLTRVEEFIQQLKAVEIMLVAARSDIETELAVIESSVATYRTHGYTAGGPKTAIVNDDDSQERLEQEEQHG